jgi:DNA (cytosine-5)-methyltransferase 1
MTAPLFASLAPAPTAVRRGSARLERVATVTIGESRGNPRLWLENQDLARAGFDPGALMTAEFLAGRVILRLSDAGDRRVSGKKKMGRSIPVIDINSPKLREAFGAVATVEVRFSTGEIVITPERTAEKRATRCRNGKEGSLFSGGGFLSMAAKLAGYTPAWGVEVDEKIAHSYKANHPESTVLVQSVSEVRTEALEPVELLTMGIPCQPFSTARTKSKGAANEKRDRSLPPEEHALGDMVFWALKVIDAMNPATVVVEEVPGFLKAGAGFIFRYALERMGYHVESRVMDPRDYGSLTSRRRAVIVATSDDAAVRWPLEAPVTRTLGDVLEPADAPGLRWWTAEDTTGRWVFAHWAKQSAAGNGFANGLILTAASTSVPTIKREYFKGMGDQPIVQHPTDPTRFRWLTVTEVRRIMEVPEDYVLPTSAYDAGVLMGNGVLADFFRRVIGAVTGRLPGRPAPVPAGESSHAAELHLVQSALLAESGGGPEAESLTLTVCPLAQLSLLD